MIRTSRTVATIVLTLSLSAVTVPAQPVNSAQRTDAQVGCTYGTRAVLPTDLPPSFASYGEFRAWFNSREECEVNWSWFPGAPGWGLSYVVAGPASAFRSDWSPDAPSGSYDQVLCTGYDDQNCAASKFGAFPGGGMLRGVSATYACQTESDFNCVSWIDVIGPDGTTQRATFVAHLPDGPKVPGAKWSARLSDGRVVENVASPGGSPAYWSYQTPQGTRLIASLGELEQDWSVRPGAGDWADENLRLRLALYPVEHSLSWNIRRLTIEARTQTDANGHTSTRAGTWPVFERDPKPASFVESGPSCSGFGVLAQDEHECLVESTFEDGYRFRVALQIEDFAGFALLARLHEPIAYSEPLVGGHRLIIEAAPAKSYLLMANVPKATMTPDFLEFLKTTDVWSERQWTMNPVDNPPMETRDPDLVARLGPYIGDRSQWIYPSWSLTSLSVGGNGMSQSCRDLIKGQVVSITSTNATAYDRTGPTFDPGTKTFSFKAAAPHFEPDGKTLAVGHYYMNMNARFMKCVLGTEKVPDTASVALDYFNGEQNIATVTVHTDKDWLRLAADNFHFSSPVIKVTFPEVKVTPTSTPEPTPTFKPAVKKTVICIKGSAVKKVTAIKPVCPKGWRLKK